MVGEGGGLVHEVAGDEDRAAFAGEAPHQFADPDDAFGVEAVGRLVEHHDLRVAEECGGDAEALAHAQRERPDPACGDGRDAGELQDLVDPAYRNAVGGGKSAEVVAGGTGAVGRLGVEEGADLAQGFAERRVGATAECGGARRGPVEAEDEAHGGGLPGAVRAEESGDPAGPDAERQAVHRTGRTVLLGELLDVDAGHGSSLPAAPPPGPPRAWRASPHEGEPSAPAPLARWRHVPPPRAADPRGHVHPLAAPPRRRDHRPRVRVRVPGVHPAGVRAVGPDAADSGPAPYGGRRDPRGAQGRGSSGPPDAVSRCPRARGAVRVHGRRASPWRRRRRGGTGAGPRCGWCCVCGPAARSRS